MRAPFSLNKLPSGVLALALCLALGCKKEPKPEEPGVGEPEPANAAVPTLRRGQPATAPRKEKWNIVLVLSDGLRAANLRAHGYPRRVTPVFDRISHNGTLFKHHYTAAPQTRSSVSQLFTGLLEAPPLLARLYPSEPVVELSDDVLILPKLLREHGYRTALVSAHPGFAEGAPALAWFDDRSVVLGKKAQFASFEELMPAVRSALDGAAAKKQPFFLYLHAMDTHAPLRRRSGFDDHVEDGKAIELYDDYDSTIEYTDYWLGQVLEELDKRGFGANTIVAFTSAHGEEFGEVGESWANRGHGAQVRAASTHVPLVLQLPPSHQVTGAFNDVSSHLDLAPTLASLAVPKLDLGKYRFDGENLSQRIYKRHYGRSDRLVFSRNERFLALRRGDELYVDAIFDFWTQRAALYGYDSAGKFTNYPLPQPMEPSDKSAEMLATVTEVARDPSKRFRALPAKPAPLAGSYPITSIVAAATERPPSYEDAADQAWSLQPNRQLSCLPEEQCGRITLALAEHAAPGRYHLQVKLVPEALARGYENGFVLTVDGVQRKRSTFAPHKAAAGQTPSALLDAGIHELKDTLQVAIEKPKGGVAIAGFELESVDLAQPPPAKAARAEPPETLRALGYVD